VDRDIVKRGITGYQKAKKKRRTAIDYGHQPIAL
jgi:hypothetical protein